MTAVQMDQGCEILHAPLATIAAGAIESLPGEGSVLLIDAKSDVPARRKDDRLVRIEQAVRPSLTRHGAGQTSLAYSDADSAAACAAMVAAAATPGYPVCADAGSIALLTLAERVAASDIPVLIDGPTGTGKEVLARFIHNRSARRNGPFVAINCAAMPEAMLEAMLFGHLKGAFTGAAQASEGFFRAADGGTLLLDEIAEMPVGLQAKLLRVLQEGEVVPIGATLPIKVDVRIVAAANRDLPTEVAEGRLRADLYYRLNVFALGLPALRERIDDIAPLAFAMLLRHGPATGALPWITDAAIDKLRAHPWPGNIRELENVIRRAMLLAGDTGEITPAEIMFDGVARMVASSAPVEPAGKLSSVVRHSQASAIIASLKECHGHRGDTAKKLGISERTLRYRLADMRDDGVLPDALMAGAAR